MYGIMHECYLSRPVMGKIINNRRDLRIKLLRLFIIDYLSNIIIINNYNGRSITITTNKYYSSISIIIIYFKTKSKSIRNFQLVNSDGEDIGQFFLNRVLIFVSPGRKEIQTLWIFINHRSIF